MSEHIKVILADDNMDFCQLLQRQLKTYTGLEVVGMAQDGVELLAMVKEKQPDVLVLDAMLPKKDGLSVVRALREGDPKQMPAVFLLSSFSSDSVLAEAMPSRWTILPSSPVIWGIWPNVWPTTMPGHRPLLRRRRSCLPRWNWKCGSPASSTTSGFPPTSRVTSTFGKPSS